MKILQINCVYPGGSTGKIAHELHGALTADGHSSVVLYGRGARAAHPHAQKTCGELYAKANHALSRLTGMPYGGALLATGALLSRIKREKPDLVHLHCINGYFVNIYRLIAWLKRHGIPTVLTLHAEFMYTANCSYAYECDRWQTGCGHCPRERGATGSLFFDRTAASHQRMKRAFAGFSALTAVSVSPWVAARAALSPIFSDVAQATVLNGIDTAVFCPSAEAAAMRAAYAPDGERLLLHVTSEFSADPAHIKGGHYLLRLAERLAPQKVRLLVVGDCPTPVAPPQNLRFLGRVSDQRELAALYTAADLTVLTSKRETYSMPVAESLSCGTPVVGFCAGGPESIALPAYSSFVPYADEEALFAAVQEALATPHDPHEISRAAHARYSTEQMYRGYLAVYQETKERSEKH